MTAAGTDEQSDDSDEESTETCRWCPSMKKKIIEGWGALRCRLGMRVERLQRVRQVCFQRKQLKDDEEELNRQRATAFMVGHFHVPKNQHHEVEKESLYGAVILIPQIGRSCRWPRALTFVTVRVYMLFLLNFVLQSMLLSEIAREQNVLDLFAGQMWLCDFGAPLEDCPSSPSCTGPGGTLVDGPRLYDFKSWSTRNFMKDSLKRLFPERESEIDEEIDPGEYGAESRICRWIACFIFMLSIQEELILIWRMACMLYDIPTQSESWIEFKHPGDDLVGDNWLEYVDVTVAGMPLRWKIINGIFILGAKFMLWKLTAEVGITFLMETQTISDCIVNSVALSFVLHMDELILMTLTSGKITSCLEKCNQYSPAETTSVAWQSRIEKPIDNSFFANIQLGIPWELMASLLLCAFFIRDYYTTHCDWTWDGWWYYSKPLFVPTTTAYPLWRAFLPDIFPVPSQSTSSWTMPGIWHA
ncbi:unnamed protein product [Cladocopium goreaui]|uniref:Uncharacterized protein n=1 Tax=Cladocopium goreaui TaxID=2562237 RepID=A0A9P1CLD7_9DINO|nr:unnamed protein product [Cladocopium goreaui]